MHPGDFDDSPSERARRFGAVGEPSIRDVLRQPAVYLPTVVVVLGLLTWGYWVFSKDYTSRSMEFRGVITGIQIPRDQPGIVGSSQSARITIRQPDGSPFVWEIEPLVGRYLREDDIVLKEKWQRVAVFRGGRQLTSGFPFRRDEVPLPTPATTP